MRKQGGGKNPNYEYVFALYCTVSVRIKLLPGSHSVTYHCYLGSPSVRFFHGVPLSKRGVSFNNFGTVRGPTQ